MLVVLNGIFVAAEFSIVATPKSKVTQNAKSGSSKSKSILAVLDSPERQNKYITTAQLGITIVSLGLGMYGERVLAEWILEWIGHSYLSLALAHTVSAVIAVSILTYVHVVIGEMIPKSLALQSPDSTLIKLYPLMTAIEKVFTPLVIIFTKLGEIIINILPLPKRDNDQRLYSGEEIEFIIEESTHQGYVEESELLIFENIFDLEKRNVFQVMTPRNKIIGIEFNSSLEQIIETICTTSKTRYPIFESNLDQIKGILHIKDLAKSINTRVNNKLENTLNHVMRTCIYVPETLSISNLMNQFKKENKHIAIVFGEHGGTSGIITLEDILEEIVGEIQDEFDDEVLPIVNLEDGIYKIQGGLILDEINQHFDLGWTYPGITTIGGLIMSELGRVPKVNDIIFYEGIKLEINEINGFSIQSVILYLPRPKN